MTYPLKWIADNLAVGYSPKSYADLEFIKSRGIDTIINLCAECYDLHEIQRSEGFQVLFLPIPDETAPSIEELEKAFDWLDGSLEKGGKALVHCRFGIGRTGTFAMAYLMHRGAGPREAINSLKDTPSRPQNRDQWRVVAEFAGKKDRETIRNLAESMNEVAGKGAFFRRWERFWNWLE